MIGPRVCPVRPERPVKLFLMFAMALRCLTAGAEA
jgi:hypothetical protein